VRVLLIVNASASSVTARARVVIHKALAADHDVTVAETSRRGHATKLAQGAAADGTEVVAVLGGDGTLNEAANGLAGTATALGVLPGGSTNVFARTIGMTNDPIEATGELLGALARRSIRPIGLGSVNGRYFLFHVGLGFDAAVVAQVERRATLKRYAGHALFLTAAVTTWWGHYDRSRPRFAVSSTSAGGRTDTVERAYFAICLNTNPYTFLGNRPLDVAPGTGLDTGLSLITFRALNLTTLLPVAVAALRGQGVRGLGLRGRNVTDTAEVASAAIQAFGPLPYQVDGDYLGEAEYFELRSEPDALRLVVP
jgi:diacylglycerol kinase family enzyme